jgi:hypothetical protein
MIHEKKFKSTARIVEYTDPVSRIADLCKSKAKAIDTSKIKLPSPYNRRDSKPESEILIELKIVLTYMRIWHVRIDVQGKIIHTGAGATMASSQMRGMPDVLCCAGGRMIALECKRSGGLVDSQQIAVMGKMKAAGALVAIVVDTSRVKQFIERGEAISELQGIPVV